MSGQISYQPRKATHASDPRAIGRGPSKFSKLEGDRGNKEDKYRAIKTGSGTDGWSLGNSLVLDKKFSSGPFQGCVG